MSNANNENDTVYHEEWISAYLDDELTDEQRQIVEARLATDPAARALLEDLKKVRNLIGDLPAWKGPGIDTAAVIIGADLDDQLDIQDEFEQDEGFEELDDEWDDDQADEAASTKPQVSSFDQDIPRHMPGWVRPAAMAASVLAMLGIGYVLWQGGPMEMLASSKTASDSSAPPSDRFGASESGELEDASYGAATGATAQNAGAASSGQSAPAAFAGQTTEDQNQAQSADLLPEFPDLEPADSSLFATEMTQRSRARGASSGESSAEPSRSLDSSMTPQSMPPQMRSKALETESFGGRSGMPDSEQPMQMRSMVPDASITEAALPEAMAMQGNASGSLSDGVTSRSQALPNDDFPKSMGQSNLQARGLGNESGELSRGRGNLQLSGEAAAGNDSAKSQSAQADDPRVASLGELPPPKIKMSVPPSAAAEPNNGLQRRRTQPNEEAASNAQMPEAAVPDLSQPNSTRSDTEPPNAMQLNQGAAELELTPSSAENSGSTSAENAAPSKAAMKEEEAVQPTRNVVDFSTRLAIRVVIGNGWQESQVGPALARVTRLLGRRLENQGGGSASSNTDLAVSSLPLPEFEQAVGSATRVAPGLKESSGTKWRFKRKINSDRDSGVMSDEGKPGLLAFFVTRKQSADILSLAFSENLDRPAWIQGSNSVKNDSDPVILLISPKD